MRQVATALVRTLLIWDRVQQSRPAIYCRGLHVGTFVSAVLGVGWYLGVAVLFLHAFCILPPCACARCRLSMPIATSRASLLPSYNLQRRIGHSGLQINKKYRRPASLVQEKVMFAIVRIHVVPGSPCACQTNIQNFLCNRIHESVHTLFGLCR